MYKVILIDYNDDNVNLEGNNNEKDFNFFFIVSRLVTYTVYDSKTVQYKNTEIQKSL